MTLPPLAALAWSPGGCYVRLTRAHRTATGAEHADRAGQRPRRFSLKKELEALLQADGHEKVREISERHLRPLPPG
jgi:hypothetical protein